MEQETRAGTVIGGRYRLVRPRGDRGSGSVWQARDESLGIDVVVRRMSPPVARYTDIGLHHPNVVAVRNIVFDLGGVWAVMPLIAGRSLAERIAADGPLTVNEAAKVARALLSALEAVHEAGLVHGNIKPANVILADSGEVLLDGFGIAIPPAEADTTSADFGRARTRDREDSADHDMFSLGATLYTAVEGFLLFGHHTPASPLAISFGEVPPPRHAGWLAPLITWLLRNDPDQRPSISQALELIDSLRSPTRRAVIFPVTIYLSDLAAHRDVEDAVHKLVLSEGGTIIERDDPVLGSWFRRMRVWMRAGADSPLTGEVGRTAAHALDARFVHAQDAVNTSTLMQPLAPVLASLQPVKEAVIRVGALLIVKVGDSVAVHQLTASQQLQLDHQPSLLCAPRDILGALDLTFPPALAEARDEPGESG